jgi:hypothetical protein
MSGGGAEPGAAMLMTLMRQLREVMRAEIGLLREMRLDRLQDLQAEKSALAASYEQELRRLRRAPELLGSLGGDARTLLEQAMRDFQSEARDSAERLLRARQLVEGIVKTIAASLGATAGGSTPPGYGDGTGAAGGAPRGRIVPLAFDRRC